MDGNVREQIDDAVFEAAAGLAAAVIRAAHEELHRAARQAGLRLRLPRSPASGANLLLENQTSKEISCIRVDCVLRPCDRVDDGAGLLTLSPLALACTYIHTCKLCLVQLIRCTDWAQRIR